MEQKKLRKECAYKLVCLFFNLNKDDRLPPIAKLSEMLDCSVGQVRTMINYLKEMNYIYSLGNSCYLPNHLKLDLDRNFTVQKSQDCLIVNSTNYQVKFSLSELDWVLDANCLKLDDLSSLEIVLYLMIEYKFTYKNYTKLRVQAKNDDLWLHKSSYKVGSNEFLYSVAVTKNEEYIDYYI